MGRKMTSSLKRNMLHTLAMQRTLFTHTGLLSRGACCSKSVAYCYVAGTASGVVTSEAHKPNGPMVLSPPTPRLVFLKAKVSDTFIFLESLLSEHQPLFLWSPQPAQWHSRSLRRTQNGKQLSLADCAFEPPRGFSLQIVTVTRAGTYGR